jgi:hypothetical protein
MLPNINWPRVWRNLHNSWVSEEIRSVWYVVIHDILPTNTRLAAIKMVETDLCRCGRTDTLQHRLTECVEGAAMWDWTRKRLAQMFRTDPHHIPDDWTRFPNFISGNRGDSELCHGLQPIWCGIVYKVSDGNR